MQGLTKSEIKVLHTIFRGGLATRGGIARRTRLSLVKVSAILGKLETSGYHPAAKPQRFVVAGRYGPLRDGELERAKAWGAELAQAMK